MLARLARIRVASFVLIVLGLASLPARGDILLDFQDIPIPGGLDSAPIFTPYQSQGFALTAINPPTGLSSGLQAHGPNSIFYAGAVGVSTFAPADPPDNVITLTQDGNTPFSALSIDLARLFPFDPAPTVNFTGTKSDGTTVTQSFTVTVPVGVAAFQTFTFTGFDDLVSLSWTQPVLSEGLHQFTNILLAEPAAVPEPSSLALVAVGTALPLWIRRRARRPRI